MEHFPKSTRRAKGIVKQYLGDEACDIVRIKKGDKDVAKIEFDIHRKNGELLPVVGRRKIL